MTNCQQLIILSGISIVSTAAVTWLAMQLLRRQLLQRKLKPVGKVKSLMIYPVKSCRGINVDCAQCTDMGLQNGRMKDRIFMVMTRDGKLVNAKIESRLLLVAPSFHDNEMWLDAPSMETLKINLDSPELNGNRQIQNTVIWDVPVSGVECPKEISDWFNRYLKRDDIVIITHNQHVNAKYCAGKNTIKHLVQKSDKAAFADFTCYLLINSSSVDDLNSKISNKVSHRNFRPNILTEDSLPYAEDKWKYVRIGEKAWFRNVKLCARCIVIITDPDTAIRDKKQEALSKLMKYRRPIHIKPEMKQIDGNGALFGLHLTHDSSGEIKVGDTVYAVVDD